MRSCRLGGLSKPALRAVRSPRSLGLALEPLARRPHLRSEDRAGASTFPQAM